MRRLSYIRGISSLFADQVQQGLSRHWDVAPIINPFRLPFWVKGYYAVKTFHPNRSAWSQRYHYDSFAYNKRPSTFLKRSRWVGEQLRRYPARIDVVFQTGVYCLPSLGKLQVPYAVYVDFTTLHAATAYPSWATFPDEEEKRQWVALEREVYERADRVFTYNETARRSIVTDYEIAPEKVIKVGAGAILDGVPPADRTYDAKTVLFAGRDFARHGGDLVLASFPLVQAAVPDAELVITASSFKTSNPGIRPLGSVGYKELQQLYRRATVVVMPGEVGGFQTLTEAMAHGCVCITAAGNPHLDDLILDAQTGFAVPQDPAALASRIVFVLKHPDLQREIGRRAAEHVFANFTWDHVTDSITKELARLL